MRRFSGHGWLAGLLSALSIAAAGCDQGTSSMLPEPELLPSPPATVSVWQMAGDLQLQVVEATPSSVRLRDERNSVMIFAGPPGQAYVNGKRVGLSGGMVHCGGVMFVPVALKHDIRSALAPKPAVPVMPVEPPAVARLGRIVIDPGHGGHDPGAPSAIGVPEKIINLAVGKYLAEALRRRGADVIMTRGDDTFIELNRRADIANENRAALFVAVHADSAASRSAQGFTVYTANNCSERSSSAASAIARRLGAAGIDGRGVKGANYRVLVRNSCPAVLVEIGYVSNLSEARRLTDETYQMRLAEAIADGAAEFLRRQK